MTVTQSILVIDDDHDIAEIIRLTACGLGLSCTVATDADTFLRCLTPETTLVMIDLVMPKVDGIELLRLLAKQNCRARVVLMSGLSNRVIQTAAQLAQTLELQVVGHLRKPFQIADLERLFLQSTLRSVSARESVARKPSIAPSEQDLRAALKRDEFVVHYQPQIEIASDEVIGVEALVRWQHPVHGLVYPDVFVAGLESLSLLDELGWMVARRAFEDYALLAEASGRLPTISLNISVHTLQDISFPDRFLGLAAQFGLRPENIVLEITESGLVREVSSTLDVLARLRMKKVSLSIDDFGSGYSMMQQLQTIPATELKIHKSFVMNSQHSSSDRVMVRKTIEIGHELGMRVIAEGVENLEQLEVLRASGCDFAQGYLFSRPVSMPSLVHWLRSYRHGSSRSRGTHQAEMLVDPCASGAPSMS